MRTHQRNRWGFWQSLLGRDGENKSPQKFPHHDHHDDEEPLSEDTLQEQQQQEQQQAPQLQIAPNDPIVAYLASASGVVEIDKLDLHSPALDAMKASQIKVVVPLVSQGELIGLLNLGPRLSQQEYSADDRKLLNDLATQTAPAVQVAQLVRQQQRQAQSVSASSRSLG